MSGRAVNAFEVLSRVATGERVVVRHLIEQGQRATDALGELVSLDQTHVVVATRRHGEVSIALGEVVAAKPVPPARVWPSR